MVLVEARVENQVGEKDEEILDVDEGEVRKVADCLQRRHHPSHQKVQAVQIEKKEELVLVAAGEEVQAEAEVEAERVQVEAVGGKDLVEEEGPISQGL